MNDQPIEELREQSWKEVVEGVRETLRKSGHTGALRAVQSNGTYIKYALDRNGMFSRGQRKGRINPHWNKKRLALKSFSIELFRQEYSEMERAMKAPSPIQSSSKKPSVQSKETPMLITNL